MTDHATGTVSVLNTIDGDTTLSFDASDPMEAARAQRVVLDMLRRGYILFVRRHDGRLDRVLSFDPQTSEYIIADGPGDPVPDQPTRSETTHEAEQAAAPATPAGETTDPAPAPRRRGRPPGKTKRVPARSAASIGVAPTAGG